MRVHRALPLYASAFGSAQVGTGLALAGRSGRLDALMFIGEDITPTHGHHADSSVLSKVGACAAEAPEGVGGLVVQRSTENA